MYSVVETGGFQYKVELGKAYKVPTIDAAVGSELELKSVLLFSGKEVQVGTPVLNDASVKVEVLAHGKYDTIIVFKKKRRTRYERRNGHRQGYTEVLVTELRSGAESAVVDPQVITRNRARVAALAKQKVQNKPLTRKEKIAQGLPKPAARKRSLRDFRSRPRSRRTLCARLRRLNPWHIRKVKVQYVTAATVTPNTLVLRSTRAKS